MVSVSILTFILSSNWSYHHLDNQVALAGSHLQEGSLGQLKDNQEQQMDNQGQQTDIRVQQGGSQQIQLVDNQVQLGDSHQTVKCLGCLSLNTIITNTFQKLTWFGGYPPGGGYPAIILEKSLVNDIEINCNTTLASSPYSSKKMKDYTTQ